MLRIKLLPSFSYFFSFLSVLICLAACSGDQANPSSFIKFFGGAFNQKAGGFKADTVGKAIYIAGSTESYGNGKQIFLLKTDQNGNRLWDQEKGVFGGKWDEEGRDVDFLSNGNILVLGYAADSLGNRDMILLQLSKDGDSIATYPFGLSNAQEEGFYLSVKDDQVTMIGTRTYSTDGQPDMYVVVLNFAADTFSTIINESYGLFDTREDVGNILETSDDKLIWCGTLYRDTESDLRVVIIDKKGNITSVKTFGEADGLSETGNYIQPYQNGYVIVGSSNSKILIVVLDARGNLLSADSLNTPFQAEPQAIATSDDGGFVIAGTQNISATDSQMLLLKVDAQKQMQWFKTFGSATKNDQSSLDSGRRVLETSDKGFLLLGTVHFGFNDVMALIKTDPSGNTLSN